MPVIDLSDFDSRKWPTAIIQIMMDPGLRHAGELAETIDRPATLLAAKNLARSSPPVAAILGPKVLDVADNERLGDYLHKTKYEHRSGDVMRGTTSGIILTHVLTWAAAGDRRASLNSAYSVMETTYIAAKLYGTSRNELKITWGIYSSVAHLWAAMWLWGPTRRVAMSTVWQSSEGMAEWLTFAEGLRRFGENFKPRRSPTGGPLLNPMQTWQVIPTNFTPPGSLEMPSPDDVTALFLNTVNGRNRQTH